MAVIGAGASGLTAIKCCLDEGITPVCFERSDYIGKVVMVIINPYWISNLALYTTNSNKTCIIMILR